MDSLFSPRWYRVASVHPRLRPHVRVSRHVYRGQTWYLLQDTSSGRHHRVDEAAFHCIGRMDGVRTTDEIWHSLLGFLGEKAPTQDETIEILCQLSDNGLLQCEITPDIAELFRRSLERRRRRRLSMLNPLAFRVPLVDPDRVLERLAPVTRFVYSTRALVLWVLVIGIALIATATHWQEIRHYAAVHTLTPRFLLLLWLLYPVVKGLHELGHALAVKAWGGEVREMGVSLLLLLPVPFVDASAASAFPEKHRRVVVGAAGIMLELVLAALALVLWIHVQDGLLRDLAFAVMVIGGVSTVVFNGNPLLRFDGYYVLSDALDIPNLGPRSNAYIGYLCQRRLLGIESARSPVTANGEAPILLGYALGSFVYRWLVAGLIVFMAGRVSFWLGVLVAVLVIGLMAVKPAAGIARFLLRSPALTRTRSRKLGLVGGIAAGLVVFLFVIPLPFSTLAQGVVWLPEQARIRAQTDGFVVEVVGTDGQRVAKGDPLLVLDDPDLFVRASALAARLQGLEVEYNQKLPVDAGGARSVFEEMDSIRTQLAEAQRRVAALRVVSPVDGTLVMPRAQDLPGGFVTQGTVLAHVLQPDDISVKVAVPQADAGVIRTGVRDVEVALTDQHGEIVAAKLQGDMPGASHSLPTAALGDRGGGRVPTDPADAEGVKTLEPVFLLDVRLASTPLQRVGSRAWVRFDHGPRALGLQWYRRGQQLLLQQFNPET